MISVIIPVYRNAESIPELLATLSTTAEVARRERGQELEVVFVVDGSPDDCHWQLQRALPNASFNSQLLLHSRNFGSFAAIRTGLSAASGDYCAVLAADLQEPPDLALRFFEKLATDECDVVIGSRENRDDPLMSRLASNTFWRFYRKFVMPEIPEKGVDVFGCNRAFLNHLLRCEEANTSLVGLIFWLGFKRAEVSYTRRARKHGKSAWTFKKKWDYLLDGIFSFTDLPIRLLTLVGLFGIVSSASFGLLIVIAKLLGGIVVPGYAATVLTVIFFGGINLMGIGIVGAYAWRTYENTKGRPLTVLMDTQTFTPHNLKPSE